MRSASAPSLRLPRRAALQGMALACWLGAWAARAEAAPAWIRAVRADGGLQLDDGRLVRLAGIDMGEEQGQVAAASRAKLEQLAAGKSAVLNATVEGEDRHGRLLAHVAVGGVWLQGALLEAGLARVRTDLDSRARAEEMLALERLARQRGIGLWAERRFAIVAADQAERAIGRFALVEGRVLKAAEIRGRVYLNFGEDWRRDFTILFEAPAAKLARRAGWEPRSLEGKRIRARGLVRSFNGPLIEATHPEQIEKLEV